VIQNTHGRRETCIQIVSASAVAMAVAMSLKGALMGVRVKSLNTTPAHHSKPGGMSGRTASRGCTGVRPAGLGVPFEGRLLGLVVSAGIEDGRSDVRLGEQTLPTVR
jgi:hypothetical protein